MSMTTAQQEELLLGLRTEVLEIKEVLADEYLTSTQISENYLTSSTLNESLLDYLTATQINDKFKTIIDSDAKDTELSTLISNCALKSELDNYVDKDTFDTTIQEIDSSINTLNQSISDNRELIDNVYTKKEIDSKGYLTEHQSLDGLASIEWVESKNYLTEHQSLSAYATRSWVTSQLISKDVNLEEYAKLTDVPTKNSQLTNDSGYLTEHQSLDNYATLDDLDVVNDKISIITTRIGKLSNLGFITIKDVESYVDLLNLDETYVKVGDATYATTNDISLLKDNIATLSSGYASILKSGYIRIKDVKEYIDGLNLDGVYAKTTDIPEIPSLTPYAKISYVAANYAKIEDIPSISNIYKMSEVDELFALKTDVSDALNDYALSNDLTSFENEIKDAIKDFVTTSEYKLYCENRYLKKSDFETYSSEFNELSDYVDNIKYTLNSYLQKSDLYNYVTKSYLEDSIQYFIKESDVNDIVDSKMDIYAKQNEMEDAINEVKSKISSESVSVNNKISGIYTELNNYATKEYVDNIKGKFLNEDALDAYIKKADFVSYFDTNTSDFVHQTEIDNFITSAEAEEEYVSKDDINSYLPNLSNYVTKSDLKGVENDVYSLTTDVLNNIGNIEILSNNLTSNYYNKTEVDSKITEVKSIENQFSNYVKKEDMPGQVDLSDYAKKSDVSDIATSLVKYAKIVDLPNVEDYVTLTSHSDDVNNIYSYIDEKTSNNDLSEYVKIDELNDKLSNLSKVYINNTTLSKVLSSYFKINDLQSYVNTYITDNIENIVKEYINLKMDKLLTKNEAQCTYLAIEDYKYIRNATVLSDAYKSNPEIFFNLFNEDGTLKANTKSLHNGMYIVGDNVYFVYDNKLLELDTIEYWHEEE